MLTCLVQVLGTHADYFIAEAQYPATEEGGDDPPPGAVPVEEKGSGCNALCYFACNDPAGDWTELPPVTPDQLVASSSIRKFFTGDLAAPVRAYPPFPGTEKEYLRAQIARVVAATILCPQGKYTIEEESAPPKVVPLESEEGYQPVPTSAVRGHIHRCEIAAARLIWLVAWYQMLKASSWLHYNMAILSIGRCTHPPKEEEVWEFDYSQLWEELLMSALSTVGRRYHQE
jgi:radial spoke head protein 4/6